MDLDAELHKFLRRAPRTHDILFLKVWGSHSHNTAKPESDIDYLGVYQAGTEEVLGLSQPSDTFDGKGPDYQIHEVRKFCDLLLKGNPGIVEMLFTDKFCVESDQWKELKAQRRNFLTCQTVKQYLGYVCGQLAKHAKGTYLHTKGGQPNEKWAYHMTRLVLDAERIINGEEPTVWKEGEERQFLMDIRSGQMGPQACETYVKIKLDQIEKLKPWNLPEQANRDLLNDWLLKLRIQGLENP